MIRGENPAQYKWFQHELPVWRDRANYICNADPGRADFPLSREQLWAKKLGDGRFEICCIPYLLFDVGLGDVITLDENGMLSEVVERSGRYVFRILLTGKEISRRTLFDDIAELGGLQEWHDADFGAIDSANRNSAAKVAQYLWDRSERGELDYETGRRRPDDVL